MVMVAVAVVVVIIYVVFLCSSSSVVSGNAGSESGSSSIGSRCNRPMALVVVKLSII